MNEESFNTTNTGSWEVQAGTLQKQEWHHVLNMFRDANLYQSWSYGAVRFGENRISHLVLKRNEEILGAAQVATVRFPVVRAGVAYVTNGPLWRRCDRETDPSIFNVVMESLRREYCEKQGMALQVRPYDFIDGGKFVSDCSMPPDAECRACCGETLLMDIGLPMDQLLAETRQTWRHALRKAEKASLDVIEGTSEDLFQKALAIHQEMRIRKRLGSGESFDRLAKVQADLPNELKMNIFLCSQGGEPVAALVGSAIGDVAFPVFAATAGSGLKLNALHLLYWRWIGRLKANGMRILDLNGINEQKNPGGYLWKSGLAGRSSKRVMNAGDFEIAARKRDKILLSFVKWVRKIV
jgi:lipid II:glycine glycyltransferase (peptidoglycan interpeptide bridge formation enzyme)